MHNTIFALATGPEKSALSIIRISGKFSRIILKKMTLKELPQERTLTLRSFYFPIGKKRLIDKCLFVWMPGPRSFTGEDSIEIYSHGGDAVFQSFFKALSSFDDVKYAEQGEFSKRAIINGKINLVKAEAINDLINSQTEKQKDLALRQHNNGLAIPLAKWRKKLISCMTLVEAAIDFSDEQDTPKVLNIRKDLIQLKREIKNVATNYEYYELVAHGVKVVFKGKPNAGKSSIFNAIIKREKSIVSNKPGTTRDIIESKINYKGYVINFFDTAGIAVTNNEIEAEGIKRTKKLINQADIILNVSETEDILNKAKKKNELLILNKIDLKKNIKQVSTNSVTLISAKSGKGIKELLNKIYKKIHQKTKTFDKQNTLILNARQTKELTEAILNIEKAIKEPSEEIIGEYLREANRSLERIIGTIDIEEVLGNIFSSFCIGK